MAKHPGGRPTVMTPETISKLEEVFAIGGSDGEACLYADICKQTLYDYQLSHPEFADRKEALKERPILKARQTIIKNLDDPDHAKWYLERKRKSEFTARQDLTLAQGEGKPIEIQILMPKNADTDQTLPPASGGVALPPGQDDD